MKRPLLVWALAWCLGCWVGAGWQPSVAPLVGLAILLSSLGAALRSRWAPLLFCFCLGAALASRAAVAASRDIVRDGFAEIEGVVASPPRGHHAELVTPRGLLWLHCDAGTVSWRDVVRCRGRVVPLDGPRNPGEPDRRTQLWLRGCHHTFEPEDVEVVGRDAPGLMGVCVAVRQRALAGIHRLWGDDSDDGVEALMGGFLLGDSSQVPPDTAQVLENTGTSHLLVASGLKVAALVLLLNLALRRLPCPIGLRCTVMALSLGLYAGVAGATWPVLRAALMGLCSLVADALGDAYDGLNALGAAVLVLSLVDPLAPLETGFQYSCIGMLGIFWFRDTVEDALEKLPPSLRGALGLTICIQVAISPLQVAQSHQLNWMSLLANTVAVPLVEGVVIVSIPLTALAAAGLSCVGLARLVRAVVLAVVALLHWMTWAVAHPAWVVQLPPAPRSFLEVTFLDVGQGDAAWVRFPCGRGCLVDAGPRSLEWDEGERTVLPFLLHSGVSSVGLVAVSHPHLDHYGGVPAVESLLPLEDVVECGLPGQGEEWERYRSAVPHPMRWAAGQTYALPDGALLRVLHPGPVLSPQPNNASLVFRLEWRHVSFLFCGDAEKEAEAEMLDRDASHLSAQVLKVPHHGSATSSTEAFLKAVHPLVAVVSVGRRNHLNLPNRTTMARLSRMVPLVMRTDRDGGVVVRTDGDRLEVCPTVETSTSRPR